MTPDDFDYQDRLRAAILRNARAAERAAELDPTEDNSALRGRRDVARWARRALDGELSPQDYTGRIGDRS